MAKENKIGVRQRWPEDVHSKIRRFQAEQSMKSDRRVTFEEAVIKYIRESKVAQES